MRRFLFIAALVATLALPGTALARHDTTATYCVPETDETSGVTTWSTVVVDVHAAKGMAHNGSTEGACA